jgi:hypothetical protein
MGNSEKETRREILKKAVYVAPVVLTLTASPAFARGGSGRPHGRDKDDNDHGRQGDNDHGHKGKGHNGHGKHNKRDK